MRMSVSITKSACAAVRDRLSSMRFQIEKDQSEIRDIIRDGCASDIDKEDYAQFASELVVVSALISRLRELERGAES